ncbi:MAG: DUF1295 domain-containing protein, partial [Chitinophagaceae bacterium]|nr:DUF1295 domain-containing protein [Chitinophagaceae bacterium]
VTLWGIRLTYNFSRRGGYHWIPWKGHEDYRWEVLRKNPALLGKFKWALFNLLFISIYQQSLILLFTLPALMTGYENSRQLNIVDFAAAGLFLLFLILETIADQQQYNFQTEKYKRIAVNEKLVEPYSKGFIQSGLWKIVRHPNYASEQAIWISFYLFSVAATGQWFNWSLMGAVLLILLFIGSSNFSEEISSNKYAAYKEYIKNTPRFFPKFW